MKVTTEELRRAALELLQHLDESDQKEFEIVEDFYWDVSADVRYKPYQEPTALTIGQLSDDWMEIGRIGNRESEPIGYALVWLAAVLRRVGEKSIG